MSDLLYSTSNYWNTGFIIKLWGTLNLSVIPNFRQTGMEGRVKDWPYSLLNPTESYLEDTPRREGTRSVFKTFIRQYLKVLIGNVNIPFGRILVFNLFQIFSFGVRPYRSRHCLIYDATTSEDKNREMGMEKGSTTPLETTRGNI